LPTRPRKNGKGDGVGGLALRSCRCGVCVGGFLLAGTVLAGGRPSGYGGRRAYRCLRELRRTTSPVLGRQCQQRRRSPPHKASGLKRRRISASNTAAAIAITITATGSQFLYRPPNAPRRFTRCGGGQRPLDVRSPALMPHCPGRVKINTNGALRRAATTAFVRSKAATAAGPINDNGNDNRH